MALGTVRLLVIGGSVAEQTTRKRDRVVGPATRNGQLSSRVIAEIRGIAEILMRGEAIGHTLQATALVNEAWMRIMKRGDLAEATHSEFLQIAAQAMRRVLVDHARAKRAEKRGGNVRRVLLDSAIHFGQPDLDLADLDEAMDRLAALDARQAKVVELRFFGGLTMQEVAESLGVSKRTVESDWTFARAWLRKELES